MCKPGLEVPAFLCLISCRICVRLNNLHQFRTGRLIIATCGIGIKPLDHIVIEFDGYYSYRDNGLLTYLEN